MVLGILIFLVNRQKSCLDRTYGRVCVGCCQNCLFPECFPYYSATVSYRSVLLASFSWIHVHRSVVNYFVGRVAQSTHEGLKLIAPIITARREEMKGGTEKSVRPSISFA